MKLSWRRATCVRDWRPSPRWGIGQSRRCLRNSLPILRSGSGGFERRIWWCWGCTVRNTPKRRLIFSRQNPSISTRSIGVRWWGDRARPRGSVCLPRHPYSDEGRHRARAGPRGCPNAQTVKRDDGWGLIEIPPIKRGKHTAWLSFAGFARSPCDRSCRRWRAWRMWPAVSSRCGGREHSARSSVEQSR